MGNRAIIVGIDVYTTVPDWNLTGAVSDALRFREWAVSAGGVPDDEEHLTLLLSPQPGGVPAGIRFGPANANAMVAAATRYAAAPRRDDGTLYFYFAGHGVSPLGAGTGDPPVLVPSDATKETYLSRSVSLDEIRLPLEIGGPRVQFFFVDACRDRVSAGPYVGTSFKLDWRQLNPPEDGTTQGFLFGSSLGQISNEVGMPGPRGMHGLFGEALLAGLEGFAGVTPADDGETLEISFERLADFVKRRVPNEATRRQLPRQDPSRSLLGDGGRPIAARLRGLPVGDAKLRVNPEEARRAATLALQKFAGDGWSVASTHGPNPPISSPLRLPRLSAGVKYKASVSAPGFAPAARVFDLEDDLVEVEEIRLQIQPGGLESAVVEPTGTVGELRAYSADPWALIEVADAKGEVVRRGIQSTGVISLPAGPYRVRLIVPDHPPVDELVDVEGGRQTERLLRPISIGGSPLLAALEMAKIPYAEGYLELDQPLGKVGEVRLGSILAYAAWASRWPGPQFPRLRALGVSPLPEIAPGACAAQVLIGDAREAVAVGSWQATLQGGPAEALPPLEPLPGLAFAGQAATPVAPGPLFVTVAGPWLRETRFALAAVPGFVTVLVVAREVGGELSIGIQLNPVDVRRSVSPSVEPPRPKDIRLLDLAWRALQRGSAWQPEELDDLLYGKWVNPLFAVVAGYQMVHDDDARARFVGHPSPDAPPGAVVGSALQNLRRFFPQIPDVHVLAALCEPENREQHFRAALEAGLPLVAEGYRALQDWLIAASPKLRSAPRGSERLQRGLLPGIAHTAFGKVPMPVRVDAVTPEDAIPAPLLRACEAVGLLHVSDLPGPCVSTALLVGPDRLVTAGHVVGAPERVPPQGFPSRSVVFDPGMSVVEQWHVPRAEALDVRALLGGVPSFEQTFPAVLALAAPAAVSPLALRRAPVAPGQKIAIVAFPIQATLSQQFLLSAYPRGLGAKYIIPGFVQTAPGADDHLFEHDCPTVLGTGGGPVLDWETGEVVGVHFSSVGVAGAKIKFGSAFALASFVDHPLLRSQE